MDASTFPVGTIWPEGWRLSSILWPSSRFQTPAEATRPQKQGQYDACVPVYSLSLYACTKLYCLVTTCPGSHSTVQRLKLKSPSGRHAVSQQPSKSFKPKLLELCRRNSAITVTFCIALIWRKLI